MKKVLLSVLVFVGLCAVMPLFGQIALKVETAQTHFLQYEPIHIKVTMRNVSGHPLVFGENALLRGTLRFDIQGINRTGLVRLTGKETPTMKGIILQPGTTRVFTYNASAFYDLRRKDNYYLKAVISHPQLGSSYESNKVSFSVVSGQDVYQALAGVPAGLMKNSKSKVPARKYRISSFNTGKQSLYVLHVEDEEKIYSIRRLGVDLGYTLRPQCAIDDQSRLHVLVAASPKVYAYYLFDITGTLEKKEVRIKTDSTPRLITNRDMGTVLLSGGRRARPDLDYEEIQSLPYIKQAMEEQHTSDITGGKKSLLDND